MNLSLFSLNLATSYYLSDDDYFNQINTYIIILRIIIDEYSEPDYLDGSSEKRLDDLPDSEVVQTPASAESKSKNKLKVNKIRGPDGKSINFYTNPGECVIKSDGKFYFSKTTPSTERVSCD